MYVLDAPLGDAPLPAASMVEVNANETRADDHTIVQCAMLIALERELQKRFEHTRAYDMISEL